MINFKEEIQELVKISKKIEKYQNTQEEYKIVPLSDLLLTISNSIKDKYNEKHPGRLNNVNKEIHMEQFEDYTNGNLIKLEDSGLGFDLPGKKEMEEYFIEHEIYTDEDITIDAVEPIIQENVDRENYLEKNNNFSNDENFKNNEIIDLDLKHSGDMINKDVDFVQGREEKEKLEKEKLEKEKLEKEKLEKEKLEKEKLEKEKLEKEKLEKEKLEKEKLEKEKLEKEKLEKEKLEKEKLEKEKLEKNSNENIIASNNIIEMINTLIFLYKPIDKENYLKGDYLQKFSSERDKELNRSESLISHDKFWSANSVEHGNIFGSVPIDLLQEKASGKLLAYGWRISEVNIYELKASMELWEVNDYCKKKFQNYLILKEKKEDNILIFEYII